MSQFFDSNPADRSPQGPKRGPWRQGLPRTWQAALDLPDASAEGDEGAAGGPESQAATSPAPGDVVEAEAPDR